MKPVWSFARSSFSFFLLQRRHLVLFINGFVLATLCYFYIEDNYESNLFGAISHRVVETTGSNNPTKKELILSSLAMTHQLGESRLNIFDNEKISSFKSDVISPVTYDLLSAKNACGSYSMILSRILSELDVPYRIAQMKVGADYGGHILVEAELDGRWVVLDPSYNLHFTRPDGQLASFADVSANWGFYKTQVPKNYDPIYQYEGVRYTNWNKIPVLMPLVKQGLALFIGEEGAETFSIRTLFLRKFHVLLLGTLILYLLSVLLIVRRQIRNHASRMNLDPTMLFPKKSEHSTALSSVSS